MNLLSVFGLFGCARGGLCMVFKLVLKLDFQDGHTSRQPRNLKHQRVESHMAALSLIKKAFSEQNDRLNGSTEWRLPRNQL